MPVAGFVGKKSACFLSLTNNGSFVDITWVRLLSVSIILKLCLFAITAIRFRVLRKLRKKANKKRYV